MTHRARGRGGVRVVNHEGAKWIEIRVGPGAADWEAVDYAKGLPEVLREFARYAVTRALRPGRGTKEGQVSEFRKCPICPMMVAVDDRSHDCRGFPHPTAPPEPPPSPEPSEEQVEAAGAVCQRVRLLEEVPLEMFNTTIDAIARLLAAREGALTMRAERDYAKRVAAEARASAAEKAHADCVPPGSSADKRMSTQWKARAEKAEKERDEANADAEQLAGALQRIYDAGTMVAAKYDEKYGAGDYEGDDYWASCALRAHRSRKGGGA